MDKYELRRLKLKELIEKEFSGKNIDFANKIGRSPSYVSRMLYVEGKAGKKNIGEDMVELLEKTFSISMSPKEENRQPTSAASPLAETPHLAYITLHEALLVANYRAATKSGKKLIETFTNTAEKDIDALDLINIPKPKNFGS